MRVHVIKHVLYEGPARIAEWADSHGHTLTEWFAPEEAFPPVSDVDLVCVMGGPMDADDHVRSPWLAAEKAWIRDVIAAGVPVLGVCLGSQILAEVLGGKVTRNPEREIGWFKIVLTETGQRSRLFESWPDEMVVGHWHGDTFELPESVASAAASAACANQAFEVDGRFVGLQFHLEWDEAGLQSLIDEFPGELAAGGPFVQPVEELLGQAPARMGECAARLWSLLDALAESAG